VPGRGRSIPEYEFLHEVAMTRRARQRFVGSSAALRVPRLPRAVILRGPAGARVGVMQQSRAPGTTMAAFLRDPAHSAALRMAAAEAHGRAVGTLHAADWAHGDLHTENALVAAEPAGRGGPRLRLRLTVIDWGRSNTRRAVLRHAKDAEAGRALWAKILRYEAAFPYRDIATHGPGRAFADAYLRGYVAASGGLRGKGPVGQGVVDPARVRADYHGQVENNVGAMFTALGLVARHEGRGSLKKAGGSSRRGSRRQPKGGASRSRGRGRR
jgi:hypothetical protein